MKRLIERIIGIVAIVTCAAVGGAQITNGLVGWWSFDDGSAVDSSAQGNNGTVHGGALVSGVSGGALELNGTSDYVEVPNTTTLNPTTAVSISGWYRAVSFSGNGSNPLLDKGASSHSNPYYQYHIGLTGDQYSYDQGSVGFTVAVGGGYVGANSGAHAIVPGAWHHIVGTWDGSTIKIYVNGVLRGSQSASGLATTFSSPVRFGKFTNLNDFLPGRIDEIRMYNRGLTASEVDQLYRFPGGTIENISGSLGLSDYLASGIGTQCDVEIMQGGTQVESHHVTLGGANTFTFHTDLIGTYDFSVKKSHWLRRTLTGITIGSEGVHDLDLNLANGDVDGDNEITLADYALLSLAFGSSIGDADYNPNADLNEDDEVSLADYSILAGNFGRAGD